MAVSLALTRIDLIGLGTATLAESGARPLRTGLTQVWPGAVMAAPVLPVWCPSGDNLAVHLAVAESRGDVALVVAVDGTPERGWWGEVLTVAAQARGVVGLVIDACVRDTAAITARRFPVWAQGVALPGTEKVVPGRVGTPIEIRGCTAAPGDWVVADADGVVIVPGEDLDRVIVAGRHRAEREAQMFEQLSAGHTTVELLGLSAPAADPQP